MQNNQMINLAIMGIGTIGKRHLMAINTLDNVKLCGIVDLTEDARSFCNYNKISIFDDLNELRKFYKGNPKGNWDPKTIFKNKDVLIIGTGKQIKKHEKALIAL